MHVKPNFSAVAKLPKEMQEPERFLCNHVAQWKRVSVDQVFFLQCFLFTNEEGHHHYAINITEMLDGSMIG